MENRSATPGQLGGHRRTYQNVLSSQSYTLRNSPAMVFANKCWIVGAWYVAMASQQMTGYSAAVEMERLRTSWIVGGKAALLGRDGLNKKDTTGISQTRC